MCLIHLCNKIQRLEVSPSPFVFDVLGKPLRLFIALVDLTRKESKQQSVGSSGRKPKTLKNVKMGWESQSFGSGSVQASRLVFREGQVAKLRSSLSCSL